jgi:heat shock protein HslJ
MQFDLEANTISGSTSCNRFNSTITLDGNTITIGSPATTKMFCEGQGEPTFVNMLPQVNSYQVKGDVLTLYRDEVEMMHFKKE